jgi:tetratricopeptide (TPR) repeat protein
MRRAALTLTLALVTGAACSPVPGTDLDAVAIATARADARERLRLPDLSRSPASVRRQLADSFARLQERLAMPRSTRDELGQAFGESGQLFMAAEYYDVAALCLLRARDLQPGEMRWPYLLGHLRRMTNDLPAAAQWFSLAVSARPDDVAALVWLGTTHLDLDQPEAAAPRFERALATSPDLVAARAGLGRVALARRDYAGAVEHLTAALAIDPRASLLHYPLALAYRGLGDAARAGIHMRERGTTEIGPPDPVMQEMAGLLESAAAYEFRGIRALERGEPNAAAHLFRRGLALEPDTASLRHRLGTTLLLLGDEPGARVEFAEAMRLSPRYAPTYYSLGIVAATHGRYAAAARLFATAIEHAPEYTEARLALAEMLAATGRTREALTHYQEVLDARPRDADAALGRAFALARLGRRAEAAARLREAAALHPERPEFTQALSTVAHAGPRP